MADRPSEEPRPGSGQGDDAPISDEMWQKFVEDSERDTRGSAPKEPSARARMVTERLRQQEARGELPEGWRTGPAWQETHGRSARRRRLWAVIGIPLAVAVAVVAMKPSLLPGDPFGAGTTETATSALPPESAAPTAPPGATDAETPTLDEPFAGSPALRWADGEAGIVLPKAKAVDGLSEDRVEQALRLTRKLLVAANLDPKTVSGGRPEAALAVLDPKQPEMFDDLNRSLRAPDKDNDPLRLFSRFDSDDVRLVGDVIKTRGRMTFEKGGQGGVAVHADYTFVYPVVRTDGSTEVTRTIVRRAIDVELLDPARYVTTPDRLNVVQYARDVGNTACDVHDGFLHPQFPSTTPTDAATGPMTDPYDRSRDIGADGAGTCGTVSRT
ncbi:hypothetical protein [Streptomyces resistomycificus]|uniref:Uncharacterized protein n=1 Tax=Streptomyces resistomycificus TaxID=67356 RepID=A0A0L8L7P8_9ACTN|nr:hypothetical protein [Streptomyces resistomycificus]KOG34116.1 hypothetical protein ADK37_20500 [Streptomyces resistomycificus]KUN93160.1 hypothetical protein AQJ84_30960 [Streptomyces resistomycificus]